MAAAPAGKYDYLVVGAGLSGAVVAERLANVRNKRVLVIDRRGHVGGNCFDYVDEDTGIRVNKYGAHLFHTNDEEVWAYVNKFAEWTRWDHRVIAKVDGRLVPIPVNITTVNAVCGEHLRDEREMAAWLSGVQEPRPADRPEDGETVCLERVGRALYEKIFRTYTYKQWAKYPEELDKAVLQRIPVRASFDDRYFGDRYQALPARGYTAFFDRLLASPNIDVRLDTDFFQIPDDVRGDARVVFTGPIDRYFREHALPALEYRSIDFHVRKIMDIGGGFFQPNSVVNYPQDDTPFTRIVEYKHFLHQESPHTIVVAETSSADGEPYYPVLNEENLGLYRRYQALAEREPRVHFVGRLASFKYWNMDEAIKHALAFAEGLP